MDENKQPETIGRRNFLRRTCIGAGAAGVAAVTATVAPKQGEAATEPSRQPGYRETEHVKRYYATASRF